jgi:hypothetical protein
MHLRIGLIQGKLQENGYCRNEKLTTKDKNKTWTNPKTENLQKSHELRPQTQHKYPEHTYLNFLPLTPSVEKTVDPHEFM